MEQILVILGALVTLVLSIAGMNIYRWRTDVLTGPYISDRNRRLTIRLLQQAVSPPYRLHQSSDILRAPNAFAMPSKTSSSRGYVLSAASGENRPVAPGAAECEITAPVSAEATTADGIRL
jgi:hypothetical protein